MELWRKLKHFRYRVLADGREIPAVRAAGGGGRMQCLHLFVQHFIAGLQAPVLFTLLSSYYGIECHYGR